MCFVVQVHARAGSSICPSRLEVCQHFRGWVRARVALACACLRVCGVTKASLGWRGAGQAGPSKWATSGFRSRSRTSFCLRKLVRAMSSVAHYKPAALFVLRRRALRLISCPWPGTPEFMAPEMFQTSYVYDAGPFCSTLQRGVALEWFGGCDCYPSSSRSQIQRKCRHLRAWHVCVGDVYEAWPLLRSGNNGAVAARCLLCTYASCSRCRVVVEHHMDVAVLLVFFFPGTNSARVASAGRVMARGV